MVRIRGGAPGPPTVKPSFHFLLPRSRARSNVGKGVRVVIVGIDSSREEGEVSTVAARAPIRHQAYIVSLLILVQHHSAEELVVRLCRKDAQPRDSRRVDEDHKGQGVLRDVVSAGALSPSCTPDSIRSTSEWDCVDPFSVIHIQ
jgi:hypothetical protein